jgi:hypothetical protein
MRPIISSAILLLAALPHISLAAPAASPSPANPVSSGGARSFDFIIGRWDVHNRRLLRRLQHANEWMEFEATNDGRLILGGAGNEDEFRSEHLPGFIGMSLRLFDVNTQRWSIYWVDNQTATLQAPVHGSFKGNVGVFEGEDEFEGKPIRVRFTWSGIDTPEPRWEQAFSADQGKTWETNWTMEWRRPHGH